MCDFLFLERLYSNHAAIFSGNILDRIEKLSAFFLGRPYLGGALGEGSNGEVDQSPLVRDDAFDCLTYVNTVLAMAIADTPKACLEWLLKLNYYDAIPCFKNRFHFMSVDWNPQNQKNGIIEDVTQEIVGSNKAILKVASGEIDRPNWFLKKIGHSFGQKEVGIVPYVPIEAVIDDVSIFNRVPQSAIIEIIRPNWNLCEQIGTQLHVSHIGFAIKKSDGLLYFRHASSDAGCVTEQLLVDYLDKYRNHKTIKGINVQVCKQV